MLLVAFNLSACQPVLKLVFNIGNFEVYANRERAAEPIHNLIEKRSINYILVYDKVHEDSLRNSTSWSSNSDLSIYNALGYKVLSSSSDYGSGACTDVTTLKRFGNILEELKTDTNQSILQENRRYFMVPDQPLNLSAPMKYDYVIFMKVNSAMRGPVKRQIRQLNKIFKGKNIGYIIINNNLYHPDESSWLQEKAF